ncbi:MAG: 4Fe-4S dicluster domain-containing protein [Spirochaetales bacterium]|nr:4Fe-4S dicluster domain-containing protein [Spirochaetales bacterium]
MEQQITIDKSGIWIVYFSGTGGVKRITEEFEKQLLEKKFFVTRHSLDMSSMNNQKDSYQQIINDTGLIILLYPVHAFDAPVPVFEWIGLLPHVPSLPVAVVSVSGGGEASLNKASRVRCIKALEKKGYTVFYETMMVMPSNWFIPTNDHLAIQLLRTLSQKTEQVVKKIISGSRQRTTPHFLIRIAAHLISRLEETGVKKFGQGLYASEECTACLWCVNNCPRENINMTDRIPRFGKKCMMCMRCIYGCPEQAIHATTGKWMVIKQGFSLSQLEKRMTGVEPDSLEKFKKDALWKGVIKYLSDNDEE